MLLNEGVVMKRFLVMLTGVGLVAGVAAGLTPEGLMCELLVRPGVVEVVDAAPEFSWSFVDGGAGNFQSAYQLQVASSTEFFKQERGDLWDSGKVKSGNSLHVEYQGRALPTGSEVYARVKVWDRRGRGSEWSRPISFKTAAKLGEDRAVVYPLDQRRVRPLKIWTNEKGRVVVDFGRLSIGWVELIPPEVEEWTGGDYKLHIGEALRGGEVDRAPGEGRHYVVVSGAITVPFDYRVPLPAELERGRPASAVKLPAEIGGVVPFRYVEIEASPFVITRESMRQIAVNYPFNYKAGAFVSSSEVLDRVYKMCKDTVQASSFAGKYVDSERRRVVCERSALVNQLSHYAVDRDFTMARATLEHLMEHPTWPAESKQLGVFMAWYDWMYSGNIEMVQRWYKVLKERNALRQAARKSDGLLEAGGDVARESGLRGVVEWVASERDGFEFRPVSAVVNAFYYQNLKQLSEMALALGDEIESVALAADAEQVAVSFHKVFYNSERGCYVDGEGASHASIYANMLPLAFGMVPEEELERVAVFVKERGMSCGVWGAQFLLEALFESGEAEAALKLMTRDELRSWRNMERAGATTVCEAWDTMLKPDQAWCYGGGTAPANIITRYVLGVRPLEPGFGKFLVQPQIGELEGVQGIVPSIRGEISVGVRREGGIYKLLLDVPLNTTARVELPPEVGLATDRVLWNGKYVRGKREGDRLVYADVSSGKHTFEWSGGEGLCGLRYWGGRIKSCATGLVSWLPFF